MSTTIFNRYYGIDVARALAIIGMMYAHLIQPITGLGVLANGYPSALFAVLAGVSLGFMLDCPELSGDSRAAAHYRLLRRALVIIGLGLLLSTVQFEISVVLTAIGCELILLARTTAWRTRSLFILLAALILAGPVVSIPAGAGDAPGLFDLFGGSYPLLAWLAYGTCGILVQRLMLTCSQPLPAWGLAAGGIGGLLIAIFTLHLREGFPGAYLPTEGLDLTPGGLLRAYASVESHTGGLGDVVLSLVASLAVICLCLLPFSIPAAKDVARRVLHPVHAMGSMPLTVYVLHVISAGALLMPLIFMADSGYSWDELRGDGKATEQDSFENAMPWETFQDNAAQSSSFEEFWDRDAQWWDNYYDEQDAQADVDSSANSGSEDVIDPGFNDGAQQYADSLPVSPVAWWSFGGSLMFFLTAASLWKLRWRRGPLETALHRWLQR